MAGDWIPIRNDLDEDPSVLAMVAGLPGIVDIDHAVGKLRRFWKWADANTANGKIPGASLLMVDTLVGVEGFGNFLKSVSWLRVTSYGLLIPRFERWMSQSAKRRLLTAKRVARHRAHKCNAGCNKKVLPQDRTGQDRTGELTGTGTGAIKSRDADRAGPDRRRAGGQTEQRNGLASSLHREKGTPATWVQVFLAAISEHCRLAGAEYNAQRDALAAVATRISTHPERASIGAELIDLAQSKRQYVAQHGGNGNPWALWQKATDKLLRTKGV